MTASQLEHRLDKRIALFEIKLKLQMIQLSLITPNPFVNLMINQMRFSYLLMQAGIIRSQPIAPSFEPGGYIKEQGPELISMP